MVSTTTRTRTASEEALGYVVPASSFVPRSAQTRRASSLGAGPHARPRASSSQKKRLGPSPPLQHFLPPVACLTGSSSPSAVSSEHRIGLKQERYHEKRKEKPPCLPNGSFIPLGFTRCTFELYGACTRPNDDSGPGRAVTGKEAGRCGFEHLDGFAFPAPRAALETRALILMIIGSVALLPTPRPGRWLRRTRGLRVTGTQLDVLVQFAMRSRNIMRVGVRRCADIDSSGWGDSRRVIMPSKMVDPAAVLQGRSVPERFAHDGSSPFDLCIKCSSVKLNPLMTLGRALCRSAE
ncbi:hypothetical protein LZ30DRAFT_231358 [Colletotrichum cereale]|nr:hypothetical protein LZ30DRAFT_231358 [Colletotrichum cereale]